MHFTQILARNNLYKHEEVKAKQPLLYVRKNIFIDGFARPSTIIGKYYDKVSSEISDHMNKAFIIHQS